MAIIKCTHKTSALGKSVDVNVIIPNNPSTDKMKVLYLLHGLSDNNTEWQRYTSIERYMRNANDTIVVMPDGGRSFYTDMVHGGKYYTYISKELPEFINSLFRTSGKREDTYIAGLSMGGYGAFKLALRNPDKYYAAASFSGVLDIAAHLNMEGDWQKEAVAILGEDFSMETSEENLLYLLKKEFKIKPKLLQMCGTEDFLYADNVKFEKEAREKGFDLEYFEAPGDHNWDFWDMCIKRALEFFGIV